MKGDFTRDTFSIENHFTRVLMQQGRVTLDADHNEQTSILLHYLTTLARDLIGPYAAPVVDGGFELSADQDGLWISAGRYYVDGLLVENEERCLYTKQPDFPLPADDSFAKALSQKKEDPYWLYLDVWEQHVTSLEVDRIRETALGGPDTCTRAKLVWQVRALPVDLKKAAKDAPVKKAELQKRIAELQAKKATLSTAEQALIQERIDALKLELAALEGKNGRPSCEDPLDQLVSFSEAWMGARVDPGPRIDDACVQSPASKYRGAQNQLYRVEIHQGGDAATATFKWSRDNGSVATPWLGSTGYDLKVANARGFSAGNWVELVDDVSELHGKPGVLVRLAKVEGGTLSVDPDKVKGAEVLKWSNQFVNPRVRRWDHFQTEDIVLAEDGAIAIKETPVGTPDDAATVAWFDLEDGIQVQFAAAGNYRSGDYWLIPARVPTGNVEWPAAEIKSGKTLTTLILPHGIVHHYAPLGFAGWKSDEFVFESCRCVFEPLSSCFVSHKRRDVAELCGWAQSSVQNGRKTEVALPRPGSGDPG